MQFETAKWFVDNGADFYVYLPALVYGENIREKLGIFVQRLREIDINLPLRVEVLEIIDYPGAKLNEGRTGKVGRSMPTNDQKVIFDLWHNNILPGLYSQGELSKYCCEILLG